MNENNAHPLTVERAAELWGDHAPSYLGQWRSMSNDRRAHAVDLLRAAYNVGRAEWKANAEAAAERAERAEDRLADSVHVDEAARRVEAAREQAWDEAAEWSIFDAERIRKANPHRPAPALPTTDGAVIVPADGREFIETSLGLCHYVMIHAGDGRWRGGADEVGSDQITPGTWRAA